MNDSTHVEISVQELKLLVNTLSKTVALSLRKRYVWLWLLAGLLIGVGITFTIMRLSPGETDKRPATSETLLKRTQETVTELRQINSEVQRLTLAVNVLNEKKQAGDKPPVSSVNLKTESNTIQDRIPHGRYFVYLHYSNNENKKMMKKLSVFLEKNGFRVSGIQKVDYQNQDVRYFHDQDKEGALLLKKHLMTFVSQAANQIDTNLKIKNLSRKYPNARNGALEVWVNF